MDLAVPDRGPSDYPLTKKQKVGAVDIYAEARAKMIADAWRVSDPFVRGVPAVSNMNRVRDKCGHIYEACIDTSGYRKMTISRRSWYHHVLVHWLTYGQSAPHVDHIDRNKANNRPDNLRGVTVSENRMHTLSDPSRQLAYWKPCNAVIGSSLGVTRDFASVEEAARELGLNRDSITRCCRGKQLSAGDWTFAYKEQPDLPGEEWREIQGLQVSSMGRVHTKTACKYTPVPRHSGQSGVKIADGSSVLLHRLICVAFHGQPTAGNDTVLHVDGDIRNNAASNLRWTTSNETRIQRKSESLKGNHRTVTIIGPAGSVHYTSLKEASIAEKMSYSFIGRLCRTTGTSKGRVFAYDTDDALHGEIFKNVYLAEVAHLRKPSYEVIEIE